MYCECNFNCCHLKYNFVANLPSDSVIDSVLTFNIFSNRTHDPENHSGKKLRNLSGEKKNSALGDVMTFGSKNTQNKMINSADLSSINYGNEEICHTLGALRQIKHRGLAFADFDKDNLQDVICLKKFTDNIVPSDNDKTPSYIRFIRADSFGVSWYCDSQLSTFLLNKNRIN